MTQTAAILRVTINILPYRVRRQADHVQRIYASYDQAVDRMSFYTVRRIIAGAAPVSSTMLSYYADGGDCPAGLLLDILNYVGDIYGTRYHLLPRLRDVLADYIRCLPTEDASMLMPYIPAGPVPAVEAVAVCWCRLMWYAMCADYAML